jgi:hypothetical protein
MKKFAPALVVLVAVLCGALALLWRGESQRAPGAEIAPPEAIVFAQLPDLPRTARRWPDTALAHLWQEPELQAFLAKPSEKMPALLRAREHFAKLRRVVPREAFVAILTLDGPAPRFVAGLRFSGRKSDVAALVAEPWATWREAWPAGRAEVLRRADWEIETYAFQEKLLAGCFHAGWYFMANDLAALEATLARCQSRDGIGSTAELQRATGALSPESDVLVFARTGSVFERLGAMLTSQPSAPAPPKPAGSFGWGAKIEGAHIRDTIFIPGVAGTGTALLRGTQALTAPESLLYAAFLLPAKVELPPAISSALALLPVSSWFALRGAAVSWSDFTAAFGPEGGVVLDWPAAADAPALTFVFEVRDRGHAARFIDSLTGPAAKGARWQRQEEGSVIHYQAARDRQGGTTPAVALAPDLLVLGAQSHAVRAVAARLGARGADLTQSPPFHEIAARVSTPKIAFAYLDLRALFERSYEALRPFLAMSLALSPELAPYFDPAKLPTAPALARHLGPSVYSQGAHDDGVRIESVGSLSFSQTLASLATLTWSSAAPALRTLGKPPAPPPPRKAPSASPSPAPKAPPTVLPAETSRKSENADETSQIQAFQR